jgi:hypothetical protein
VQLIDGRLQAHFNLGSGQKTLLLNNSNASDGQWHVARFHRRMYASSLMLDNGEGRNSVFLTGDLTDSVYMTLDANSQLLAGAILSSSGGTVVLDRDLVDSE